MDEKILHEILAEIKDIKTGMTVMQQDIKYLKSDMIEVKKDTTELRTDMVTVKQDIKEIKQDIRDINIDIFKIMARDSNTEQAKKMELVFNTLDEVYGKKKN